MAMGGETSRPRLLSASFDQITPCMSELEILLAMRPALCDRPLVIDMPVGSHAPERESAQSARASLFTVHRLKY